ncbi:MAG: cellulase family glycosylhydrolase, partial [Candidatus Goldiibacteriota bacterium]
MFSKLKTLNLIILILTLFSILLIAAPAELHVVGNQLETISGGCPVRLVGVDIDGLEWSPAGYGPPNGNAGNIQQSVAGAVNTWHANFVRIPVSQDFWFGYGNSHGTPASASAYQQFIMNAVTEATSLGCYVEIDLHWSGTGSFGTSVNQESMPDDNSTAFWQAVATAYSGYTNVFFDLYNEPINDTWAIWKGGGQSVSGFHTPGFQALVKTIRDTGAKNIIVIGGLSYSWDMTGISANSITDTNTAGTMSGDGIMYEAHIYDNKGGSSEAAKIALWNQYVAPAVNAGFCVDIGEFGSATDGSEDSSGCTPFETDLVSWINGNNTAAAGGKSYVFNAMAWDFNTTASPVLLTDWSFDPTSCHGVTVKNWLAAITPVTCGATTPTFTLTLTRTPTKTFTPTSTKTFTLTSTLTYTQTVPSATPSFTRTFTPTFTGTYTSTVPSATPSFTRTFTPTFTGTYTSTVPSATPSFTRTFTPTFTGTYTSTVPSATPSFTRTFTPTFTVT